MIQGARDKAVAAVANRILDIGTLVPAGRDSIDFKELYITALKEALEAAYDAGVDSVYDKEYDETMVGMFGN